LQASIRRDGSSVFGEDSQWGYFPSAGVAWRAIEESFMTNQTIFDDLKLRASYGITGNSLGFNPYSAQFIIGGLGTYYYNGSQVAAYGPTVSPDPNLKWEKTSTVNIGLDFAVLKNKINGTIDWYDKETTDMIYTYSVDPALVPVGNITSNGGSISNRGIEVSISATPVQRGKFSWNTTLNLAHNKNEITSLSSPYFTGTDSIRYTNPESGPGTTGHTLQIRKIGKPIGQFFTNQYAGKDESGISQFVAADGSLTNGPAIGVDYQYMGSPQPKLLMGWVNNLSYGNWSLNFFFRGVFGNKIFNVTRADMFTPGQASQKNLLTDVANESKDDSRANLYSSRFIENGSYVRLDNATLSYNFKNLGNYVKGLRLYTTVNNAFVITKYKGIDPEINQGGNAPGIDSNNFYPKTRTFLLGLNVSF
jgi:TonB-dependent starch-binding outer membrane protein SusC